MPRTQAADLYFICLTLSSSAGWLSPMRQHQRDKNGLVARPLLVVVTGPPGSGKTSLAHRLADAIGCPAICRDQIKEGLVFSQPAFEARTSDEFTRRTLPVFFRTVGLLLECGVTTVAEAAFQHHVWAPNLVPLADLAAILVIRCRTDDATARGRVEKRAASRSAHADASVLDDPDYYNAYRWLEFDAPSMDVDTTDGYDPTVHDLAAWVRSGVL